MKNIIMMIATAALVGAPADTHAATDVVARVAVTPVTNVDKARVLKEQAESLYSQPRQWKRAARLLEESAELRPATDAEAYTCLALAARLRDAVGEHAAARQILERAAAQALARGSVLDAAHAYIDAAHVALKERNSEQAHEFVSRALLLSASPLLSDDQRTAVTRRVAD